MGNWVKFWLSCTEANSCRDLRCSCSPAAHSVLLPDLTVPENLAGVDLSYSLKHCGWHLSWCKGIFTHFSLLNLLKMQQPSEKRDNRVTFEGDFPLLTSCWTALGPVEGTLTKTVLSLTWEKCPSLPRPKGFQVFCTINTFIWSTWTTLCHGNFMNFEALCKSLPAQDILWLDLPGLFHRTTQRITAEFGLEGI